MDKITVEYLQEYIRNNQFDLHPTQDKISFPMILRYCKMLVDGDRPLPIKIEDDAIVDGHHRYISGHIVGTLPDTCNWTRPKANEIKTWDKVIVYEEDFTVAN